MKYKVEGHSNLYRDSMTGAIIDNNNKEYSNYIQNRSASINNNLKIENLERNSQKIENLENEIYNIKDDLSEIKNLLKNLINVSNSD